MDSFVKCFLFVTVFFLQAICLNAQNNSKVSIAAIPHPLFWENTPRHFEITESSLILEAGSKTDMFRDPNVTYNTDNAPKLFFVPDEDFILTASIRHDFREKWDGGAIVLKKDSLHWVKFCFEKDYTGAHRVVSVVTKGISDDCNSVSIEGSYVYFKIAKAGNVVTLYYGTDNRSWFLVRHLQIDAGGIWKAGFLAQSPLGESCKVVFAEITYRPKKISDPYLGE